MSRMNEAADRILVVDDEPEITEMLDAVLSAEGWLVEQAASGEEALERFRDSDFDIVVLDHKMPMMSGLAAATELVGDGARPGSIVLFSGYLSPFILGECRSLGIRAVDKTNWEELVEVCHAIAGEAALWRDRLSLHT